MNENDTPAIPEPWFPLDDAQVAGLEAELRREVSADHVLSNTPTVPMARRQDRDDVLFQLQGGRWAIVHLTFSRGRERSPNWPAPDVYASRAELEVRLAADAAEIVESTKPDASDRHQANAARWSDPGLDTEVERLRRAIRDYPSLDIRRR